MELRFGIIPASQILVIIPLLQKLEENSVPEPVLKERVLSMATENYECLGIYDSETLIGICGLWYQTRHYAGKNVELDHVYIDENFQNKGIGKKLIDFIANHVTKKGCNWMELNTYVHNFPSHKFYYNQGFVAKGYHFVKEL